MQRYRDVQQLSLSIFVFLEMVILFSMNIIAPIFHKFELITFFFSQTTGSRIVTFLGILVYKYRITRSSDLCDRP